MSSSLQRLLPLFDRELSLAQPMVLATLVRTAGPTYSKAGAHLLLARSGEYRGLLSGGCLEGDLGERARSVFEDGIAQRVRYDMRSPDDLLFGLGSGCEGAMDILLQRLHPAEHWQPMQRLAASWRAQRAERLLWIVGSAHPALPIGSGLFCDGEPFGLPAPPGESLQRLQDLARHHTGALRTAWLGEAIPGVELLALVQPPPPRLLLLGAGPDAQPVVELAAFLGWHVTVIDHRSHYAQASRFPAAAQVLDGGVAALDALLSSPTTHVDAAVVMSHHLATDLAYLRALASHDIAYVGLLGPAVRRERLLGELGIEATRLRARLHAPVGLDIGANSPETIALSIISEIHAELADRTDLVPCGSDALPNSAAARRGSPAHAQ